MHFNTSFTPFLSLRVLELIHEAKWLTRLGIQIPDAAIAIMQQESRFKSYKSHLELVLNEYKEVCEAIPEPLQKLFTAHKDHVEQQLQPGLSTLAWNSMNIGMDLLIRSTLFLGPWTICGNLYYLYTLYKLTFSWKNKLTILLKLTTYSFNWFLFYSHVSL